MCHQSKWADNRSERKLTVKRSRITASGQGFTLIELMIVVAVVGVLLALVLPGYAESVRKSHRADGMRNLMELASRQERFYAQNGTYTVEISASSGLNLGRTTSSEGYYALSVSVSADDCGTKTIATCYKLIATPIGGQAKDTKCAALSIDNLGQRSATGSLGDQCW